MYVMRSFLAVGLKTLFPTPVVLESGVSVKGVAAGEVAAGEFLRCGSFSGRGSRCRIPLLMTPTNKTLDGPIHPHRRKHALMLLLMLTGCSRSPVDLVGTGEVASVTVRPMYEKSSPDAVVTEKKEEIDNLLRGFRSARVSEEKYAGCLWLEVDIAFSDGELKAITVFSEPNNMVMYDDLYFCDLSSFLSQWETLRKRKPAADR